MNKFTEITLTDEDLLKAESLAKARDAKKSKFGSGRHGKLTDSSEKSHLYGLAGEVAICNYLKIPLDETIYSDHGDEGYDLIIMGMKADVKVATHPAAQYNPWLKVPCSSKKDKDKLEKSDIFICCSYDKKRSVRIWGWVDKATLKNRKPSKPIINSRTGKPGPVNYMVFTDELENIQKLVLTQPS